jgi:hypothetical protein
MYGIAQSAHIICFLKDHMAGNAGNKMIELLWLNAAFPIPIDHFYIKHIVQSTLNYAD